MRRGGDGAMPFDPRAARRWGLVVVALAAGTVACGPAMESGGGGGDGDPRVVRPGAPGDTTRAVDPDDLGRAPSHTPADVAFMRGMIRHHRQALEMSALVDVRTARSDIALLGRRVELSQRDEIQLMESWLGARGEAVSLSVDPSQDSHGPARMPGMLTPDQMQRLSAAEGGEFDQLFLAAMIIHHRGALSMVGELFDKPGAGREDAIFQFANHVASDQSIEIARMQRMLNALVATTP